MLFILLHLFRYIRASSLLIKGIIISVSLFHILRIDDSTFDRLYTLYYISAVGECILTYFELLDGEMQVYKKRDACFLHTSVLSKLN